MASCHCQCPGFEMHCDMLSLGKFGEACTEIPCIIFATSVSLKLVSKKKPKLCKKKKIFFLQNIMGEIPVLLSGITILPTAMTTMPVGTTLGFGK